MKKKLDGPLIIKDGKVFDRLADSNGLLFFMPSECGVLNDTRVRWMGGKISWQQWINIFAYAERVSDEEESECQWQFFCNDKEIIAWAFPQTKKSGMVTKELQDDPNFAKQMHEIRSKGYYPYGTGHTHNRAGAFQSGTDMNDEAQSEGLHITLGKVSKTEPHEIHARFTAKSDGVILENGEMVMPKYYISNDVEWTDFVALPFEINLSNVPVSMKQKIKEMILLRPCTDGADQSVIETWMKNRIEPKKAQYESQIAKYHAGRHGHAVYDHGVGYGYGYGYYTQRQKNENPKIDWSDDKTVNMPDTGNELFKKATLKFEEGEAVDAGLVLYKHSSGKDQNLIYNDIMDLVYDYTVEGNNALQIPSSNGYDELIDGVLALKMGKEVPEDIYSAIEELIESNAQFFGIKILLEDILSILMEIKKDAERPMKQKAGTKSGTRTKTKVKTGGAKNGKVIPKKS